GFLRKKCDCREYSCPAGAGSTSGYAILPIVGFEINGAAGANMARRRNEMARQCPKGAGMAMIVLASSFGVRQAAPPTPPPAPSELAALIKRNADGSLPQRGGIKLTGATPAATSLGWNFKVCTASYVYSPNAFAFTVFARNADGTEFFESTSST